MNVAQPIIDLWRNLARREQVLAGVVVLVAVIALVMLLMGGEETAPIDASTSAAQEPITERAVEPAPGTIVANKVPAQPIDAAPAAGGVAPISGSGSGGGGDATSDIAEGIRLEQAQTWADVEAVDDFPPFSESVAAAGRDLERVAAEYRECVTSRADIRPCVNVIKFGIFIDSDWHQGGRGITLTKVSTDGHRLDYTIMGNATDCRALDGKPSCTAWSTD